MNHRYVTTSDPATEPISLQSLKDAVRIRVCDFDEELSRLLTAGRFEVEKRTQRRLVTQTVTLYADCFPDSRVLELRMPPVQSVSSVKYLDTEGDEQTLSSANYDVDVVSDNSPARIMLKDGFSWPSVDDDSPNAVYVEFIAGYGAIAAVEARAKLAVVEWVKTQWKHCEGSEAAYERIIGSLCWCPVGVAT